MISIKKAVLIFVSAAAVAVGVYLLVIYLGREPDVWESERRVEEAQGFGRDLVWDIRACGRYSENVITSRQQGTTQIPDTSFHDQQTCYYTISDQCQNKYGRENPLLRACDFFGQVELNRRTNPN